MTSKSRLNLALAGLFCLVIFGCPWIHVEVDAVEVRVSLAPTRATIHPTSAMLHLAAEVPLRDILLSGELAHTLIFANLTSSQQQALNPRTHPSGGGGGGMPVTGVNTSVERSSLQVGFSGESSKWLSVQRIEWTSVPVVSNQTAEIDRLESEATSLSEQAEDAEQRLALLQTLDSDYKNYGTNLVSKETLLSLIRTAADSSPENSPRTVGSRPSTGDDDVSTDLNQMLKHVLPTSMERLSQLRESNVPLRRELHTKITEMRKKQNDIRTTLVKLRRTEVMAKVYVQFDKVAFTAWAVRNDKKEGATQRENEETTQNVGGQEEIGLNVNASVWASTIISAVRWRPSYEFRFNTTDDSVAIHYHAQVYQQTPLPWENVTLELCTGEPTFGRKAPELEEWNIALRPVDDIRLEKAVRGERNNMDKATRNQEYKKSLQNQKGDYQNQNYRSQVRGRTAPTMTGSAASAAVHQELYSVVSEEEEDRWEMDEEVEDTPEELSSVTSSGVSDVFVLSNRHSLPSAQEVRLPITSLTLKSTVSYVAVPKLSTKVFIQARVFNKSPFTLLPGSALLFADGNFISTTNIPLLGTDASTSMDVGIEPKMSVKRKLLFQNDTETGGMFKVKATRREFRYNLMIQSKRSTLTQQVLVKDTLPRTNDEKLGVFLRTPTGLVDGDTPVRTLRSDKTWKPSSSSTGTDADSSSVHDGDAMVSPAFIEEVTLTRNGQLRWLVEAPAGQTVEVPYHFSIAHGLDFGVSGLDDL